MIHENKLAEYCRVIEQLCNTIEDSNSSTDKYSSYLDQLCVLRGRIMHCKFMYLQSLPPLIDDATAMKIDKIIGYAMYSIKRSEKCTKYIKRTSDYGQDNMDFGDLSSCEYSELYDNDHMSIEFGKCGTSENGVNSELYSESMPIYQIRGYKQNDKQVISIKLDSDANSDIDYDYRNSQINKSARANYNSQYPQLGGLIDSNKKKTIIFMRKDCGACQQLEPKLNKYMANHSNIDIVKMHPGDQNFSELSNKYNVNVVPTMIHGDNKISGGTNIINYLNRI